MRVIPWAIAGVTFAVFAPALLNGFVEWDDHVNLLKNEDYRGLGLTQLRWMFTATLMGHYIPVTWLTFGLDYLLWGMEPFGYHLTNLLLHAVNAVLVYALARRLLGRVLTDTTPLRTTAGAVLAALAFALHPLRAESVAWATERRDVLSACLFFVVLLLYLGAAEARGAARRWRLAGALGAFVLAILAKSIVMTLPLVLVLLDIYPLGRLGPWRTWGGAAARSVWLEKLPFAAIAALAAEVSWWAVARNDFFTSWETYPAPARAAIAFYGYAFYVVRTALPLALSPLYELPARVDPFELRFVASAAGVLAVTLALVRLRRRWPAGLAAWAAYGILLAPVSGFIHAGHQLAHDRYSYLSCVGLALLLGGLPAVLGRAVDAGRVRPALARVLAGALPAWLLALSYISWHQTQVWRDTETLWTHAVEVQPECAICRDNLGTVLVNNGLTVPGMAHLYRALEIRPDFSKAEGSLGLGFLQLGRPAEAEARLRRAVDKHPADVTFLNNLGTALLRQGKYPEAVEILGRAIAKNPREVLPRANRAASLAGLGRVDEAVEEYRRAIAIKPNAPEPRVGLAQAYLALGDPRAAREQYEVARRLSPALAAPLAGSFTSGL